MGWAAADLEGNLLVHSPPLTNTCNKPAPPPATRAADPGVLDVLASLAPCASRRVFSRLQAYSCMMDFLTFDPHAARAAA